MNVVDSMIDPQDWKKPINEMSFFLWLEKVSFGLDFIHFRLACPNHLLIRTIK